MRLDVIIPAWIVDRRISDLAFHCVRSLRRTAPEARLIIVDNGSPLMGEWMRDNSDVYVRNTENLGYAKAVNQGFALAREAHVAVANDDILFHGDWADRLAETCGDGISCPMQVTDDGLDIGETAECALARLTGEHQHDETSIFAPFDGYGSLWLARKRTLDALSYGGRLLDEGYEFGMFEDRDLWARCAQSGRQVVRDHRVWIWHAESATWKVLPERKAVYAKNRRRFEDRWGVHPEIYMEDSNI